jgi:DNA-binding transcriptional regulator of glucitol operon
MKLSGVSVLLLIVFILIVLQSIGGVLQVQSYRKAVRRMHRLGNVGMGQKRGKFFDGHVAIIACDNDGIITGAEVMDGIGVWARFHKVDSFLQSPLIGNRVSYFIEKTESFSKSQFRRYRGYIRALEALDARLEGKELTREQERYMERKKS